METTIQQDDLAAAQERVAKFMQTIEARNAIEVSPARLYLDNLLTILHDKPRTD